jgi:hypothetical protein
VKEEQDKPDSMGLAVFLVDIWAMALQVPMRRMVGKNFIDMRGVMALVFVFFYGGLWNSLPVFVWLGIYVVSVVAHRIATLRRHYRGVVLHSRYNGYPWLGVFMRRPWDETRVKMVLEPLLAMFVGAMVSPYGESSAMFFFGGAVCMFLDSTLIEVQQQKRVDDLNDASIESKDLMTILRKRR